MPRSLSGCRPRIGRRPLLAGAALPAALVACGRAPPRVSVHLADRVPLAAVQLPAGGESAQLRLAIAGVISPVRTLDVYRDLLAYLGQHTGQTVELVQRATYAETNLLLRGQAVQIGSVCSLPYVIGQREFGLELLVAPVVEGRPEYYSLLIVRAGHPAERLEDLQGASFAFSDPLSNSGRLVPTVQVRRLDTTPERFFSRTVYTYGHDNAITAVADGLVDATAIGSLTFNRLVQQHPELLRRLRVVARWGPYGIPPMVVPPDLEVGQKETLRALFSGMEHDTAGRQVLAMLRVERFAPVRDSLYDSVRQMAELGGIL